MEIEIIKGKKPPKKYAWVLQGPIEGKKEKKKEAQIRDFSQTYNSSTTKARVK